MADYCATLREEDEWGRAVNMGAPHKVPFKIFAMTQIRFNAKRAKSICSAQIAASVFSNIDPFRKFAYD